MFIDIIKFLFFNIKYGMILYSKKLRIKNMINESVISMAEKMLKTKISEDNFPNIYVEKLKLLKTYNKKNKEDLEIIQLKIEIWNIDIRFIDTITKMLQEKDYDYKKILLNLKEELEIMIPKIKNIKEAVIKTNSSLKYINRFLKEFD